MPNLISIIQNKETSDFSSGEVILAQLFIRCLVCFFVILMYMLNYWIISILILGVRVRQEKSEVLLLLIIDNWAWSLMPPTGTCNLLFAWPDIAMNSSRPSYLGIDQYNVTCSWASQCHGLVQTVQLWWKVIKWYDQTLSLTLYNQWYQY